MQTVASSLGLNQDTAYLYMQGHCVYDLLHRIGDSLSNNRINFRYQVLEQSLTYSGYPQMDCLISDIKAIL